MADRIRIKANEIEFEALTEGEGKVAILLHGFPDSPVQFKHQLRHLAAAGMRAVAPWLRGYSPSDISPPYDMATLVEDARQILLELGVTESEKALVVGHDWGGIIAYALAGSSSDLVENVVVLSVPHPAQMGAIFAGRNYDQLKRSWYMYFFQLQGLAEMAVSASDMEFIDRLVADWSPSLTGPDAEETMQARKDALGGSGSLSAAIGYYRAMFSGAGGGSSMSPVPIPALVIFGNEDGCLDPRLCDGMEAFFQSDYRFEVIEGAGHFVPIEKPDQVNALIDEFIGAGTRP